MRLLCDEPEGEVWREVRLVDRRDISHMMELSDKLAQVPNFLNVPNPYSVLLSSYFTFFEVDDVGMLGFAMAPAGCTVHITFWDKRLRGREKLCREMAQFAAALCYWNVWTSIPENAKVILAFAKRVGFEPVHVRDGIVTLKFNPESNYPV